MYNIKGEGFLVRFMIEIPQSHPLLTLNIHRPSRDGGAHFQSPAPAAYHGSLTLITRMRLVVPASPPPPVSRTSAQP